MTYEETIHWLYEQLPMFSRIGAAAYKKDLHNTIALCNALGNPQHTFPSVHIAGTNGKGSTSHMLAAIFQQCGYKTGLYTSPHIHDFRERIRINGKMINREFVVAFAGQVKAESDKIQPSFFELTVAMAFEYFAREKVEIAIIETGLGGRLDSTNVITPVLSVITNIGFDHMALLGDTLEKIAFEKAGIIKPGVPVVIGETLTETEPVFTSKAQSCQAPVYLAKDFYQVASHTNRNNRLHCSVINLSSKKEFPVELDLTGHYQAGNLCTVLAAADILRREGFSLDENKTLSALHEVKKLTGFKGRWDLVSSKPDVIVDVAHNVDGIRQILHQLDEQYPSAKRHFVLGFVQDKDIGSILQLFSPSDRYYFTQAHIPRALPHQALKEKAASYGLTGNSFDHVDEALEEARKQTCPDDVIVVCGSFFTIAELSGY